MSSWRLARWMLRASLAAYLVRLAGLIAPSRFRLRLLAMELELWTEEPPK